jgi:cytochrome c-type biogenesis protein CcmH
MVMAGALGLYLSIGSPSLPDAPFAARLAALKHRDPTSFTADEALAILSQAARDNPGDPRPLFYLGQVLLDSGRAEEAARVFDAALRRDPSNVEAMLGLGRSMVAIDDGRVSAEALALFEQAGAMSDDAAPFVYQAMAAMQEDRAADAQRLWGQAYARMAPDDPRRAMAQRMSTGADE